MVEWRTLLQAGQRMNASSPLPEEGSPSFRLRENKPIWDMARTKADRFIFALTSIIVG
jgi:hypothetical protein